MPSDFACSGVNPAPVLTGVDTLDLAYSSTPGPDLIALAATPTGNGILTIPLSRNQPAASITVSSDFNGASLPLSVTLCATDPATGTRLAPPGAEPHAADRQRCHPDPRRHHGRDRAHRLPTGRRQDLRPPPHFRWYRTRRHQRRAGHGVGSGAGRCVDVGSEPASLTRPYPPRASRHAHQTVRL